MACRSVHRPGNSSDARAKSSRSRRQRCWRRKPERSLNLAFSLFPELQFARRQCKCSGRPQHAQISQLHLHHRSRTITACQDAVWFMGFASDTESELCCILLMHYLSTVAVVTITLAASGTIITSPKCNARTYISSRAGEALPDLPSIHMRRRSERNIS